jgi:hypothetical protein
MVGMGKSSDRCVKTAPPTPPPRLSSFLYKLFFLTCFPSEINKWNDNDGDVLFCLLNFSKALESLLIETDVDLVLAGHLHSYERIHPVDNYEVTSYPTRFNGGHLGPDVYKADGNAFFIHPICYCSKSQKKTLIFRFSLIIHLFFSYLFVVIAMLSLKPGKGPVYVVQGNTGAMQFEKWDQPQPAWSAVRFANGYAPRNKTHSVRADGGSEETVDDVEGVLLPTNYSDTFGFGVATFVNRSHMYYRMVPVTGSVGEDLFWIIKEHVY